ncbi:MAG: DUF370 domain-containing protein [Thermoanaerobacteraceae bacterium]|nr:DUF370 domain-containing protein [Thermoanaerobacteraceae bacterium]
MYLHIGGDVLLPLKDIVGIFDYEKIGRSAANKEFWAANKKGPRLKGEPVKSFIVTTDKKIYFSSISPVTLGRRAAAQKRKSPNVSPALRE